MLLKNILKLLDEHEFVIDKHRKPRHNLTGLIVAVLHGRTLHIEYRKKRSFKATLHHAPVGLHSGGSRDGTVTELVAKAIEKDYQWRIQECDLRISYHAFANRGRIVSFHDVEINNVAVVCSHASFWSLVHGAEEDGNANPLWDWLQDNIRQVTGYAIYAG